MTGSGMCKMLSFVSFLLSVAVLAANAASPPTWPRQYTVRGTIQLPYAEIREPFDAYFDADLSVSRIDYYSSVITLQNATQSDKEFGKSYKVVPITTETERNVRSCFLVEGAKEAPIATQTALPDLTGFQYAGTGYQQGRNCEMWQNVTMIGKKKNTYTMWVDATDKSPIRYEMMGYDSLMGSHYDKYYLVYTTYSMGYPHHIFKLPEGLKCGPFPGPGVEHRITFNPMREFVDHEESHIHEMFGHFKAKHDRKYDTELQQEQRKTNFRQNLRYIHSKNRASLGFSLQVNHLADWTDGELRAVRGRRHSAGYNGGLPFNKYKYNLTALPDQVDWRLNGAVTPVKDQAICGSCWSFGTTGTIEGAHFLKTGELVRLSQQELMDCSWGQGNNACDGGEDFRAYEWIVKHGGLATEESYGQYLAQDSLCHNENATIGATMKGFVNVTSGDLEALKVAIANHGPISVGIDASHKSLSFYANGVYYEPQCGNKPNNLDHAVLAVGYGVMKGEPYWLVKNSWSTYWGNNGYVLMSQKDNNCGVATGATYVLM